MGIPDIEHVPLTASDDDVRALAEASRGRPLTIELGRATWDGGQPDFAAANAQGASLKLPGNNVYYMGSAYVVQRSLQAFAIWQDVCGADVMGSTILRALSIGGNVDTFRQALANVYKSTRHNGGQLIDVLLVPEQQTDEAERLARLFGIALVVSWPRSEA